MFQDTPKGQGSSSSWGPSERSEERRGFANREDRNNEGKDDQRRSKEGGNEHDRRSEKNRKNYDRWSADDRKGSYGQGGRADVWRRLDRGQFNRQQMQDRNNDRDSGPHGDRRRRREDDESPPPRVGMRSTVVSVAK